MRICIIGKFPPIQGGVSMRTYWSAHGLAACGHDVHVVTNAKEAMPPFRMHMRADDWERCEGRYGDGSVTVHWTDPVDRSQSYIPMASPFVSKLAAIAAQAHAEAPFDVIFSFYMEPYGVAGHLAAQMTGAPHVVRMAGSDAGRLWRHPQLEPLYDHVLRSAETVIAAGPVAERAVRRGVDRNRIMFDGGVVVPQDVFTPEGPVLDLASLRREVEQDPAVRELAWGRFAADRPHLGIYGKLGENKGSFALLAALHRLKRDGLNVGLVALAHGTSAVEARLRSRAEELDLADSILQLPFLPHWRVPEFVRGCLAVCCLEQDFPIAFHSPIIPREVLLCGACLVASAEVVRKLPGYEQLPDGFGCVAIKDVNDVDTLSERLAAIVRDPGPVTAVGARGCAFARALQSDLAFPQMLERILELTVARQRSGPSMRGRADGPANMAVNDDGRFPLARLAADALTAGRKQSETGEATVLTSRRTDLAWARDVLAAVEAGVADGRANLRPLVLAVRTEIAVAAAESAADAEEPSEEFDPLFRLRLRRWAMAESDLAQLVPLRDSRLHIVTFEYDVAAFLGAQSVADLPAAPSANPSYIAVFARSQEGRRDPLLVDGLTARILELSDGTRTAAEVARQLDRDSGAAATNERLAWIESLVQYGLVGLLDTPVCPATVAVS